MALRSHSRRDSRAGWRTIAERLRYYSGHPKEVLILLGIPMAENAYALRMSAAPLDTRARIAIMERESSDNEPVARHSDVRAPTDKQRSDCERRGVAHRSS
jgi:hypothetical protein